MYPSVNSIQSLNSSSKNLDLSDIINPLQAKILNMRKLKDPYIRCSLRCAFKQILLEETLSESTRSVIYQVVAA